MPVFDASGFTADFFGLRSELGARVQDLLARKSLPGTAALGAIARKLEAAISTAALKGALSELVAHFRRVEPSVGDKKLEQFFAQIHEFGRKESIENYGAYIFTVDVTL